MAGGVDMELPSSSCFLPLSEYPFDGREQLHKWTGSGPHTAKAADSHHAGGEPLPQNTWMEPAAHRQAQWASDGSRSGSAPTSLAGSQPSTPLRRPAGGFAEYEQTPPLGGQFHGAPDGGGGDSSRPEPPTRLPPLKHMLRARASLPLDTQLDQLKPAQRARPESAAQLDSRLALAQQSDRTQRQASGQHWPVQQQPLQQPPQQPEGAVSPPGVGGALNGAPPQARVPVASPESLSMRELMEAAAVARRLEGEAQALHAQLVEETAERRRCAAALKEMHAANDRLNAEVQQVNAHLQAAGAEGQRAAEESQELHAANDRLSADLQQLQGRLQASGAEQQRAAGEAQQLLAANDRLSSEVQQLHGQLHATGAEQQRAAEEALKLQAANETLQRQLKERDTAGQALAAQAAAMHDALSAAEAEIARLQQLSKSTGAEASTLQEQLAAAQAEAAQVRGEAEAATRRLRAAQAAAAEAEDHVQHLQQELSYVKQRADEAASEGRGLEGAAGRLKDENRRLVSQAAHLQAQLDRTSSEARSKSAEAAGLARNLAEAEAAANAAARDAGAARRRCGDLDHQNQMLHAQFLAAREEAADMRARYRRLDQTSMSNFEGSPAAGATPTRHRQSLGAPPEQVCYPSHGSSGGGGAAEPAYQQQLPAPPTPSPQDIDRYGRSGRRSSAEAYGMAAGQLRPATPEQPLHHYDPPPAAEQHGSQQPPGWGAPERDWPGPQPRQTGRDNGGVSADSRQQMPPQQPPQQSPVSPERQQEAEEFFMRRGGRRAAVEGGGDAERSGNRPFGTEQSLEELMEQTKEREGALMRLMMERNELSCEFAKMPAHGGRTIAERRRKAQLEARLEAIDREASTLRLQLKRLGVT